MQTRSVSPGNKDTVNVSISRDELGMITSILIVLGDHAVELDRQEAEKIFVQLGHVLQDMDIEQGVTK